MPGLPRRSWSWAQEASGSLLLILDQEMAGKILEARRCSWVQVHAGPCTLGGALYIEFSSALAASEGPWLPSDSHIVAIQWLVWWLPNDSHGDYPMTHMVITQWLTWWLPSDSHGGYPMTHMVATQWLLWWLPSDSHMVTYLCQYNCLPLLARKSETVQYSTFGSWFRPVFGSQFLDVAFSEL